MTEETFDRISKYYDKLVESHGRNPRSCDYGQPASQQTKFETLAEFMPLHGKTTLDVGCGLADFAGFLQKKYDNIQYTGIDITPNMIKEATQARPDLDLRLANILDGDIKEEFDVIFANGIFYLLGAEAPDLMRSIIRKMFGLARDGIAFNSLSSWANDKEPGEFYANPSETLEFCRQLTPWVALRHDYHSRDFTIYMYREQRHDRIH